MITSIDQLDLNERYTYSDYILWRFQERVELLKGKLSKMAAPNLAHQEISGNLYGLIWTQLRNNPCKLYAAPIDVRLPLPESRVTPDKIDTIVQPDLCVICDLSKLENRKNCIGAPDLIVEILSPGNSKKEMKDKFELYEAAGVLEYWIVNAEHRYILVYNLDIEKRKFTAILPPLTEEDILKSQVIDELQVPLSEVFPNS